VWEEAVSKASVQHEAAILWIPNLSDLCDLLCINFPAIGRKGIGTEGRKDHEGLMVVQREASIGVPAVLEA
jgi:hypothetical protein